jgi:carotenoid cleavage dioxygenase-like enzyme
MADYEYLYQSRTEDLDLELSIEGALPESIQGTLYAIGGAGCKVGDTALSALDAHGRVVAVSIAGGKAQLRARMVQTPLWKAERGASAIVKRRLFTNKPGRWSNLFDLDLANPAGHNVVPWGKDVVAANDPGFFVLDPQTLETRGPAPIQPKKGATFGPMPRRDPATGRHVVFEQRPGLKDTIIVREIDDGFQVAKEQAYSLGRGAAFFHDVAFTERYYLIMQFASLSVPSFAWGAATALEALRFEPESTPVMHLLPRAGGAPITVPLPGGRAHFHFWNAFEEGGAVVADTLGYDGKVTFGSLLPPAARPARAPPPAATPKVASWRYHIDPASRSARPEKLDDVASEAPEIRADRRGRSYRYGWAPAQGRPGGRGRSDELPVVPRPRASRLPGAHDAGLGRRAQGVRLGLRVRPPGGRRRGGPWARARVDPRCRRWHGHPGSVRRPRRRGGACGAPDRGRPARRHLPRLVRRALTAGLSATKTAGS